MERPLTDKERKMVEENEKLIYYTCHAYNLDISDYYGTLAIGLCKAAQTYDESKGFQFSTYAIKFMLNEAYLMNRNKHLKSRTAIVISFDEPVFNGNDGSMLTLGETIFDQTIDIEQDYINKEAYVDLITKINALPETYREIVQYRIDGLKQREIAVIKNVSQETISRTLQRIRKQL